jgi:hypothetical protein
MFSPLFLTLVTMTSSLAPLLQSVPSSTTSPLPFLFTIQPVFLCLVSYPEWLIRTPPHSLGGSCKHTMSAISLTPATRAAMVHLYDLAQFCWIALIIDSQGFRFNLSSSSSQGGCRTLGHRNDFSLLLFLPIHQFRFASLPVICHSLGPMLKHHAGHPRCHASGCICRCPPTWPNSPTLPRRLGGLSLLYASVPECNVLPIAVGALLQRMTAE